MELRTQQKFVALAFTYGDNRDFLDLIDPVMFGDFAPVISVVKQYSDGGEILYNALQFPVMQELIECDMDTAFHYRHGNFRLELMRLYEIWIDTQYKSSKKSLDREASKKINTLYEKLQKRLSGIEKDTALEEANTFIAMAKEKNGARTGLDFLDAKIGWLRSGTVTRVSGYSNVGKSKFMYRVIVNSLRQGKTVHVFSLEVPKGMVLINLVSAYYNINSLSVEAGRHDKEMAEFYEKYKDNMTLEDDKFSIPEIQSAVEYGNRDIIFIDYVQNMRAEGKGSEYEKMTQIAQEIQKMAITTKKPFFDLSQVSNDGARNYEPGDMIPSKGSGAFVHACDIGLVLYKGNDKGQIKLCIAKNKFGMKDFEFTLNADFSTCGFSFLSDNSFG